MSFLTEMTVRRMATISRTAARSSNIRSTVPRAAFSTTVQLRKNPVDAAKDGLKKVDRAVSDKLVDGIEIGSKYIHHTAGCWNNIGSAIADNGNSCCQGQGQGGQRQHHRRRCQGKGRRAAW